MFANRFAADRFAANMFAAVLTTKSSEVSPLQSKMDKLVMMINQGINEVIADDLPDTEVRDFPQCKIQAHTSVTFVTVKRPQLGCKSFINR